MIKYFKLDDSETSGIAKVEILKIYTMIHPKTKNNFIVSKVKVIEIIKQSTLLPRKVGQKLTVANTLLMDTL